MNDPTLLEIVRKARELHRDAIVIDAHADTPSEFFLREGYDFGRRSGKGQVDLPRLREGGVDLQFLVAWVPAELSVVPGAAFECAANLCRAIDHTIAATPGARLVRDSAGFRAAREGGEVAFMIGVEGGHAIENSLERLRELHALGARYLTLTWNNANDWADSSAEPPRHGGLTGFGREVVRELGRLGMMVDLSHVSVDTFYQALEVSEAPVIASHSCAAALAAHHRNLDDDQLRALADAGGVVGVNFFPAYLDEAHSAAFDRVMAEAERFRADLEAETGDPDEAARIAREWQADRLLELPPVGASVIVDHIEHVIEVAGIDHVALGSDFDGISTLPSDLPDCSALPLLTELLAERGHDPESIRKVLGGNMLRVMERVIG